MEEETHASRGKARPLQVRKDGWTAARKRTFLEYFCATSNASFSSAKAGMSETSVYALRRRDPAFREAWLDAIEQAKARVEAMLWARGGGTAKTIAFDGGLHLDLTEEMDTALAIQLLGQHRKGFGSGAAARRRPPAQGEHGRTRSRDPQAFERAQQAPRRLRLTRAAPRRRSAIEEVEDAIDALADASPETRAKVLRRLGACAGAVALHNAATRWNRALLDNAARPSGAMVYDPGDGAAMSGEQFARLQAEMEAGFAGAGNAGRPMLLEGGLKWQAMSMSPADMDFQGLKAAAARDIALAFGVPPMLLGLPGDATYANYREANRALWRLTILPLAGKILGGIGAALGAWWPGVRIEVDLDLITALSEDRERLWGAVSGADFLSAEEKREMLGFSPSPSQASPGPLPLPRGEG